MVSTDEIETLCCGPKIKIKNYIFKYSAIVVWFEEVSGSRSEKVGLKLKKNRERADDTNNNKLEKF